MKTLSIKKQNFSFYRLPLIFFVITTLVSTILTPRDIISIEVVIRNIFSHFYLTGLLALVLYHCRILIFSKKNALFILLLSIIWAGRPYLFQLLEKAINTFKPYDFANNFVVNIIIFNSTLLVVSCVATALVIFALQQKLDQYEYPLPKKHFFWWFGNISIFLSLTSFVSQIMTSLVLIVLSLSFDLSQLSYTLLFLALSINFIIISIASIFTFIPLHTITGIDIKRAFITSLVFFFVSIIVAFLLVSIITQIFDDMIFLGFILATPLGPYTVFLLIIGIVIFLPFSIYLILKFGFRNFCDTRF